MAGRILVISPHPDDESLGCGGTIRTHVEMGDAVKVVFLTSGESGGHEVPPDQAGPLREKEARRACEILGVDAIEFWQEPDGALRVSRHVVDRLVALIESDRPGTVFVTHPDEDHADHRAAAELVEAAIARSSPRPKVFQYEVWTPLQRIDRVVDISDVIDIKASAIRAHESQCAVLGFEPAFLGLARYRGEMHSWPGGPYAEVFAEPAR